jgi:formate hydrogenlyase transcriptional activator
MSPSYDLLLTAFNNSLSATVVCDPGGLILFANRTVELMFGYDAGELVGRRLDVLVPGGLGEVGAVRSVDGQRKNGSRMPVEIEIARVAADSDGGSLIVTSIVDVTARRELEERLAHLEAEHTAFDRVVADIATSFASAPFDKLDDTIIASQQRLVEVLGLDRSSLWQQIPGSSDFAFTHYWARDGTPEPPPAGHLLAAERFPYWLSEITRGQAVWFTSLDELPSPPDRASFESLGTKSNASVPLVVDQQLIGFLTFGSIREAHAWTAETLDRLRMVGAVFAHSLARRNAGRALEQALVEVQHLKDKLALENVELRKEVKTLKPPRLVAADSAAARQVLAQVEQVAPTPATVLMLGETGSGKEVFAQMIHDLSPRHGKPMIRVNCAAIPTALIESELFGRERGAYTGAFSRQIGRFEVAHGSTIFLDEIGELPLEVQVKLLRVLQDRVIERLGSSQSVKVDVRIIAATNKDLEQAVASKTFREDLYYRLNVFPIRVPPLRERLEDIPSLVWTFIEEFSKSFGKNIESVSKESLQALQQYGWPGNVRELRNVIEHAVIVSSGPKLTVQTPRSSPLLNQKGQKLSEIEVDHIRAVLQSTGWRVRGRGGAAEVLGIKPTTLESRMAKLGIRRVERPAIPSTPTRQPAVE